MRPGTVLALGAVGGALVGLGVLILLEVPAAAGPYFGTALVFGVGGALLAEPRG